MRNPIPSRFNYCMVCFTHLKSNQLATIIACDGRIVTLNRADMCRLTDVTARYGLHPARNDWKRKCGATRRNVS